MTSNPFQSQLHCLLIPLTLLCTQIPGWLQQLHSPRPKPTAHNRACRPDPEHTPQQNILSQIPRGIHARHSRCRSTVPSRPPLPMVPSARHLNLVQVVSGVGMKTNHRADLACTEFVETDRLQHECRCSAPPHTLPHPRNTQHQSPIRERHKE
ncbi:hypothetical protein BKA63DRAFT_241148 [Paraphoma chrysanthemicola]|nr:hypothetical protein BKA63DRAFT_241148 [Paraphoma chrysanthemicola]